MSERTLFLTKEELATHYFIEKLSQEEVAQKYTVSRSAVYRLQKKYNLEPLEDWERRYPRHLSQIQKEVLSGSIFGDDCIFHFPSSNYSCLIVSHAISQKEYAELKFGIWKNFIRKKEITKTTRSNGVRYGFCTGGHPEFEEIRNRVYVNRIKTIDIRALNYMTPVSLAFWFQDDGSRCKNGGLAIHTNSFRFDEVQLICEWFFKELKIVCKPQLRAPDQYVVFFSNKTSDKFAQIILPWVLPTMRYKLAGVFTKNPQRLHAIPFRLQDLIPQESAEDIV